MAKRKNSPGAGNTGAGKDVTGDRSDLSYTEMPEVENLHQLKRTAEKPDDDTSLQDDATHYTFFKDLRAASKSESNLTLPQLAERIRETAGPTMDKLPLFTPTRFGNVRNNSNCLRHDANVEVVTGLALDYDAGNVSFNDGIEILRDHGVRGLIYTTRRHTLEAPRWRMILPLSSEMERHGWRPLVDRVAATFGAMFDTNAMKLSQSFYYGAVVGSEVAVSIEVVDGDFVDVVMDANNNERNFRNVGSSQAVGPRVRLDPELMLREMTAGNVNDTLKSVTASYLSRGYDIEWVIEKALNAAMELPFAAGWNRAVEEKKIRRLCDVWLIKHPQARESLEDFYAYMPMHQYIYVPARALWPAASVDGQYGSIPVFDADGTPMLGENGKPLKMKASAWLDKNKHVEQMTWAPGEPTLMANRLVDDGGFITHEGNTAFNLYRPPTIEHGNKSSAQPWLDHVQKVYPDNADHIIKWCASRVQRPGVKVNHAIVLGGDQGIGKDTLLEPVKRAVGPWNFQEVSPKQCTGRFNGFLKSVILRVSEARDLGEVDRFQFYEHMKVYTAAPPDVLRVDEKNLREYGILNCSGVVITTNRKDGLYLPADDRRHYVAWSNLSKDDFDQGYWNDLWGWYDSSGDRHVAAYLASLDLTGFDVKAPPPKTDVFWQIVQTNQTVEESETLDVLDALGRPDAVTLPQLKDAAARVATEFYDWLMDRKNNRTIGYRLGEAGYSSIRKPGREDGFWSIKGIRNTIYAKTELSERDRTKAAADLVRALEAEVPPVSNNRPLA